MKIARQAAKRAGSPTEGAILRAAGAFAAEDPDGRFGACLSNADFDAAWARAADDLQDILLDRYPDFVTHAYAEAGLGTLRIGGSNCAGAERATRLFLCPVAGPRERVAAFASDAAEIGGLERSLGEFGVVPEGGRCLVLPFLLPLAAFAPDRTAPGRVRALHDTLSARLSETLTGAVPSPDGIREAVTAFTGTGFDAAGSDTAFGALAGIELVPPEAGGASVSPDEIDAEDMARAAAVDSWHDSYAAEIPGMAIGAPLDWPACAAALAWETIRIPMEAALRRRGMDGRPEVVHCAPSGDGERLVVSAVSGSVAVGPFSAPSALAWLDTDEFFGRAETGAETFVEHDDEGAVIAPLVGAA